MARNAGSLPSVRSGARHWHMFATSVLGYKEHFSTPPRHPDHALCWLSYFSQHDTACTYLQYLTNFCDIENLSTAWYDSTVQAWKKGAHKLKLVNGFKNVEENVLFIWTWIQSLVRAFDNLQQPRVSLFILVSWQFLLRPLSEAFPIQVGDQRDT